MVIDGASQPGSTLNTSDTAFDAHICVVIAASPEIASVNQALLVLAPNPTAVTVRGLGFSGIVSPLIFFSGSGHRVMGNQFGGSLPSGPLFVQLNPNNISVSFSGSSNRSIIGGPDRIDRNVIAGAAGFTGIGILVGGVQNQSTEIRNNLIGINRGGLTAAPLGQGVVAVGPGHVIVDNRIGGCSTDAIRLATADHVTVQNNEIGGLLPNGVGIILNAGSSSNTIGAVAAETGRGNRISNNLDGAIWIDATAGIFNRVRDNQLLVVESPADADVMVLDLGAQGADANDPGDGDSGPNNRLNYPELSNPVRAGNTISFTASIDVPAGNYTMDVYTAGSCLTNGRAMADRKLLTSNFSKPQSGVMTVPVTLPANALSPSVLGATLTDSGGNTSEMSNCLDIDRIFADDFE
ncbi:MAG: right-handed parallel beta-helix repeat-containing protein, partial [Dokdonella sp.]